MRGSAFRKSFRILYRESESIETSPGFVQFLGEKFNVMSLKNNNQEHVAKNLSNDKCLEVNVSISRKILSCIIRNKKNDRKRNERNF